MGIQINEIMYDFKTGSDDGREWVEIFNNSDQVINLTSYKFFEADTNHKLKLVQGDIKLSPNSYAVITSNAIKFKTDWPGFSGTILDSSFSLSNDGEAIAIKDGDVSTDQFFYKSNSGGGGDGNSMQLINGVWLGAKPTPGAENKITYVAPPAPKPVLKLIPKQEPKVELVPLPENKKAVLSDSLHSDLTVVPETNLAYAAESTSFYFPAMALIVLVSMSACAVYFIRRKPVLTEDTGNDFEILE